MIYILVYVDWLVYKWPHLMTSFTIGKCSVFLVHKFSNKKNVKDIMFSSFLEKLGHCYNNITVN